MSVDQQAREDARATSGLAGNPYILLALASLFWSGNHIVGRAIAGHVPPVVISTARWLLLAIVTKLEPRTLLDLTFNRGDIIIVANMALVGVYTTYLRLLPRLHWLSFIFVFALISAVGTLPFAVWEHVAGFTFQLTTLTLF